MKSVYVVCGIFLSVFLSMTPALGVFAQNHPALLGLMAGLGVIGLFEGLIKFLVANAPIEL